MILRLLRAIEHSFAPRGGLARERWFLVRAMRRNEAAVARMDREAEADGACRCCVSASYGGTMGIYNQTLEKLERQEARLQQIDARLTRAREAA